MKKKFLKILMFILPLVLAVMVPLVAANDGFGGVLNAYINLIDDRSETIIDTTELDKNLIKGSLSGTDKYSYFQEMSTYNSQVDEYQDANFVGIGVSMIEDEKGALVSSVFLNSPAYRAGIKSGDVFVSVDGISIAGKTLVEIASLIKGPAQTSVIIGILENGLGEPVNVSIVRDLVEIKTVTYTIFKEAAYIRITGFTNKTGEEFAKVLDKVDNAGIDKLIIDLRDNGGGTVRGCIDTARKILSDEVIVKMDFRYKGYLDIRYVAPENPRSYVIAIIVNENTASAAEILSAAVQDNEKGILVGESTFGKSLVQSSYLILTEEAYQKYSALTEETNMYVVIRTLQKMGIEPDEDEWAGAMKMTIGEYLTPNGKSINNVGIEPDFTLDYSGPIAFDQIKIGEIFVFDKYNIGMESIEIKKAQGILEGLGFYSGAVDGIYDKDTFEAVMSFQAAEGLYPYGVLDYTTQNALNNRLRLIDSEFDGQLTLAYNELMKEGE